MISLTFVSSSIFELRLWRMRISATEKHFFYVTFMIVQWKNVLVDLIDPCILQTKLYYMP